MKKMSVVALMLVAGAAQAYEAGDMVVRTGGASVHPDASSSSVNITNPALGVAEGVQVDVDDDTQLGVSFTYFITPKLGIEVLGATPFKHDIIASNILAGAKLAETKHLPPTISVQFYPMAATSKFQPYVGAGLNYTLFFEEYTTDTLTGAIGALADIAAPGTAPNGVVATSTSIELDDSVGLALQAGFDYALTDKVGINAGIWYVDISTTADITAQTNVGTVNATIDVDIDPMVYMIGVSYKL